MYEVTTKDFGIITVDGRRGLAADEQTITFHGRSDPSGFHPTVTFPLVNVVHWKRVS